MKLILAALIGLALTGSASAAGQSFPIQSAFPPQQQQPLQQFYGNPIPPPVQYDQNSGQSYCQPLKNGGVYCYPQR